MSGFYLAPVPVVTYEYNARGQVTQELFATGGQSGGRWYDYNNAGSLTDYSQCWATISSACDMGDPAVDAYHAQLDWHADGRVDSVCVDATSGGTCDPDTDTAALRSDYAYDAAGQIDTVTETTPAGTSVAFDYDFDLHGNPIKRTTASGVDRSVFNTADQLVGQGSSTCTLSGSGQATNCDSAMDYDDAGRPTTTDNTTGYDGINGYNARGQMDYAALTSGATTLMEWDLHYDGDGLATKLVENPNATGEDTFDLIWDTTRTAPQIMIFDDIRANYGINRVSTIVHDFFAYDWQGSTIKNADFPDHPTRYDPYGKSIDPGANLDYRNFGYRGELQFGDLVYLRNRFYNSSTGQFATPDPLDGIDGTPTVANTYHYTDNDPVNKTDPLGLRPGDDELGLSAFMDMCVNVDLALDWPPWQDDPGCSSYYTELTNMTKAELLDAAIDILQWPASLSADFSMMQNRTPSPIADSLGLVKAAQAFLRGGDPEICGLSPGRSLPVLCISDAGPALDSAQAGLTLGHVLFCATTCGDKFDSSVSITWNVRTHEMVHVGQFDEYGDALLALSKLEDQRVAAMGLGGKAALCEHRYERPAYDADGRGAVEDGADVPDAAERRSDDEEQRRDGERPDEGTHLGARQDRGRHGARADPVVGGCGRDR